MLARRVKLRLNTAQVAQADAAFAIGTGVWNWGLSQLGDQERAWRQYGRETPPPQWAPGAITPGWVRALPGGAQLSKYELYARLNGHSKRLGVTTDLLRGVIDDLVRAWADYRAGERGRPRRKGLRNRLSSLCVKSGVRYLDRTHLRVPGLGDVRIHAQQDLAALCVAADGTSRIKQARLQRLPRGWYLTLQIDAAPKQVPITGDAVAGVDLGFSTLATLSDGTKIENPAEYRRLEQRLGQAARAKNYRLLGRLQQRLTNARRVRNHLVSRRLVGQYATLYVSRDNLRAMQRTFGKSIQTAALGQLLTMCQAKSRQAGRVVVEVSNLNSTRTCSHCGDLTGPRGQPGLRVRQWDCGACGAHHDRDVNAAVNTLVAGAASAHRVRARARV